MWTTRRATPGTVCQEGGIFRFTGLVLVLTLCLIGCASKPKSKKDVKKEPAQKEEPKRMNTTSGETTFRRLKGSKSGSKVGVPVYTIRWKTAELEYEESTKNYGGTMHDVSGDVYQEGVKVSTFTAETGNADKQTGLLRLDGHVHFIGTPPPGPPPALDPKAVNAIRVPNGDLICDQLELVDQQTVVKATGNVIFNDSHGTLTAAELWASPDLKFVSTPDLYSNYHTLF